MKNKLTLREQGAQAAMVWMCKSRTKKEMVEWVLRQPDDIDYVTGMTDVACRWGFRDWGYYAAGMDARIAEKKTVEKTFLSK